MQASSCGITLRHDTALWNSTRPCCDDQVQAIPWLKRIDLICRVALGTFAALLAPWPFAASAGVGMALAAAYAIISRIDKRWLFPLGDNRPVCAQGYMDFLTGVRFPPLIGALATAAFIAAHMRHDPLFYVPFCGICLGFWAGRNVVNAVKNF